MPVLAEKGVTEELSGILIIASHLLNYEPSQSHAIVFPSTLKHANKNMKYYRSAKKKILFPSAGNVGVSTEAQYHLRAGDH